MSFGFLGTVRVGQWLQFRKFMLRERAAVGARIACINAELARIGTIGIIYEQRNEETTDPNTGATKSITRTTEVRRELIVSKDSTLEKLLQAYIVAGGNPLDVSAFMHPDNLIFIRDIDPRLDSEDNPSDDSTDPGYSQSLYPNGGVVAPKTSTYHIGGVFEGGYLTWGKYIPARTGGDQKMSDLNQGIAAKLSYGRRWVNQAIRERRHHIEARIIKMVDLREQLLYERDVILRQAVAGTVDAISTILDPDEEHPDFHVSNIDDQINGAFFDTDDLGFFDPNTVGPERDKYTSLLDDIDGDQNHML